VIDLNLLEDGIYVLKINRPEVLNALSKDVIEKLDHILDELKTKSDARALIVTGEGPKAFVAGADIAAMSSMSSEEASQFCRYGQSVFTKLENMTFPVIAAVNGFCLGGGFELALACDFIFASENAKFGLPEVSLGLIPGFGGTQRLSRNLGLSYAKYLITTGHMVPADELLARGLVIQVVPQDRLMAQCLEVAKTITKKGPQAIRAAKLAIHEGFNKSLDKALKLEEDYFAYLFSNQESKEGMSAFLEKRPAKF
jgi:enoyl-CoA hydratase